MSVCADPSKLGNADAYAKAVFGACLISASTAIAAGLNVPAVRTAFYFPAGEYNSSRQEFASTAPRRTAAGFQTFAPSIALSAVASLVDGVLYATKSVSSSNARRFGEAVVGALAALATYVTLGGTCVVTAILASLSTFYVYTNSTFDVTWFLPLGCALSLTLTDGFLTATNFMGAKVLLGITYALYTVATMGYRRLYVKPDVAVILALAGRTSFVWQAFSLLTQLHGNNSALGRNIMFVSSIVPFTLASIYIVLANEKEPAFEQLPVRVVKKTKQQTYGVVTFKV